MHFRELDLDAAEIPLHGGDVTEGLVRKGDTVRRPRSASSEPVGLLLRELERRGFDGAPRHLGTDTQGRDVLSFIDGEVAIRPWPDWVADPERARSVARLLRRYDDAAEHIGVPEWSLTLATPDPEGAPPNRIRNPTLIGHLDVTPENVVFRDGAAVALIDFDLARPATRAWELANVLLWWAPWMPAEDREPVLRDADPFERGRLIVDAYGLDAAGRAEVVPVSQNVADRSWHLMRRRAHTLGGGWARMWDEGVGDRIVRRQRWLSENASALSEAVAG
ncbi:phosphotransferase [Curtobacterium ammoniigenes]|uniref:phosphotransferase n=1 Tax=Curtobacterium ammoniigenes TaxID=395387 RepID=UPI0008319A1D|nr:phosphotransferase [Curtobacterium ammoniigenes]